MVIGVELERTIDGNGDCVVDVVDDVVDDGGGCGAGCAEIVAVISTLTLFLNKCFDFFFYHRGN